MGKKTRAFISSKCIQDLIENKENINETMMVKHNQKKFLHKCSEKSSRAIVKEKLKDEEEKPKVKSSNQIVDEKPLMLKQGDNSSDVNEALKDNKKITQPLKSGNLAHGAKCKLKKQDFSEAKNYQSKYKFHDPRLTKEAIIMLRRCDDHNQETTVIGNSSTVILVREAMNTHTKSKSRLSKYECQSSHLLKEAIIVLERIDEIPKKCTSSNIMPEDDGNANEVPNKSNKGSKRKREEKNKTSDEDSSKPTKSKKQNDSNESKKSKKDKIPDVAAIDFSNDSKSPSDKSWNFKISSWNVNGIRAWLEKNGLSYLHHEQPDILCIQETKCSDDKLPDEMKKIDGYHTYWLSGDKDGYSGVGMFTKEKPIQVEYGIGISEHDNEGRVITAEYEKFYLVSAYVPNAGRGLVRLEYRMKWDKDFREYLKNLDAKKPIILTGDLNVAHEEIDLANPKTNKKNAGFTKEEREGFSTLLKEGSFIDTFRHLYPDVKGAYTFWTYMMNARAKNVGWRLDYFVMSERFTENLCDNVIRKDVMGSDHCPITLFLSL